MSDAQGPAGAYLNRIAVATPANEVHQIVLGFARTLLADDPRRQAVFSRMAARGGIDQRYSCMAPATDPNSPALDAGGIFRRGAFPGTAERMGIYETEAPKLAQAAVERLALGDDIRRVTHLIVTTCTGLSAPGIDLELIERCGLSPSVERTIVGFMGCYAAISALKLARHIVRSDAKARVLVVSVELCTLHLQETTDLESLLSFCLWGDGCAAALVTAEPDGFLLESFKAVVAPDTRELMTWNVRDQGFDMVLSGAVPAAIHDILGKHASAILDQSGTEAFRLWAIHPGGRSILDAVERALDLSPEALAQSREVLRRFGNLSSATVMFVLAAMLAEEPRGQRGCAMAFGPGLTAETMLFRTSA